MNEVPAYTSIEGGKFSDSIIGLVISYKLIDLPIAIVPACPNKALPPDVSYKDYFAYLLIFGYSTYWPPFFLPISM